MALGNRHGPEGLSVGPGNAVLMAMPWIWSALQLGIPLWDVLVTLRLQPCAVRQLKPPVTGKGAPVVRMALNLVVDKWHDAIVLLVAGPVNTGVYYRLLYSLRMGPGDRQVLSAFQGNFNRWRF